MSTFCEQPAVKVISEATYNSIYSKYLKVYNHLVDMQDEEGYDEDGDYNEDYDLWGDVMSEWSGGFSTLLWNVTIVTNNPKFELWSCERFGEYPKASVLIKY